MVNKCVSTEALSPILVFWTTQNFLNPIATGAECEVKSSENGHRQQKKNVTVG